MDKYYRVKSTLVEQDGIKILVPDVDCLYRIIRPYRDHDDSFIIETDTELKSYEEKIKSDDPRVTSRQAWWDKCKKDADKQKEWKQKSELSLSVVALEEK